MLDSAAEPCLLLVDDEPAICTALSLGLREQGRRVLTASHSREARELLGKHRVGALLLDLQLLSGDDGEGAGLALFEWVRREHPRTRVAVLTGGCPPAVRSRLEALGVHVVLSKPQPLWALRHLVAAMLKEDPED